MKQQYACLAVLLAASVACQKPAGSQSSQASAAKPGVPAAAADLGGEIPAGIGGQHDDPRDEEAADERQRPRVLLQVLLCSA